MSDREVGEAPRGNSGIVKIDDIPFDPVAALSSWMGLPSLSRHAMSRHTPGRNCIVLAQVDTQYGPTARNRLAQARTPTFDGARAALESFYYAFNHRDSTVLAQLWLADPLVQLNNPLGGILRGSHQIARLYQRIFDSPGSVQVTFGDIVESEATGMVVFAGRETGQFTDPAGRTIPLHIRTTQVFAYDQAAQRWGRCTTTAPSTTPTRSVPTRMRSPQPAETRQAATEPRGRAARQAVE